MKRALIQITLTVGILCNLGARAATRYVNIANTTPATPFNTWDTAATNIQDAVDVAVAGETVLVTNGVYATGGRAVYGLMTNRVAINKPITVRSVSGPNLTFIVGQGASGVGTNNGDGAIRCIYVGTNAILSGFTLTNGHTRRTGDYYKEQGGGGAWCEVNGMLTNCILTYNSANSYGGGAYNGTINDCILNLNSASLSSG